MTKLPKFSDRCQCGAISYTVSAGTGKANVCFCEIFRRASGPQAPPFVNVPRDRVNWKGRPAVVTSSEIATRGFCPTCGTALYYVCNGSTTWGLAAGTADVTISPDEVFYHEQHPEWLASLDALPRPEFETSVYSGDGEAT